MQYRRFGKTEMNLSVFTLGLMRYMSDDPEASARVVQRAVELGINHLETARGYDNSEELLGYALKTIDRSKVYVSTKIRPRETYDRFMKDFETSMSNMEIDELDYFALHGINNEKYFRMAVDEKQTWRAVRKLMDAGTIKHIGFSTHGKTPVLLKTVNTGMFEAINLHYYWFYQVHEPVVARASELDMGVFIISPNDKGGMLYKPPEALCKVSKPFHPMNLNNRWLLSDPRISTLSLGAAVPGELDRHMEVASDAGPLTAGEQAALDRWAGVLRDKLGRDYCTVCQKCLPCPQLIDIPEVLRWRNLAVGLEMTEFGNFRYNLLDGTEDWFFGPTADCCTECGECLPRCPEKLEIPRLLFDAHDLLKSGTGQRLWG
ncbi:MAG: aldo/keto reductase [Planctomycetota bacterium]|nr:MAG: aldo/keto reductase [Planctomycetota bacterium]